jgi:hypothetical protein
MTITTLETKPATETAWKGLDREEVAKRPTSCTDVTFADALSILEAEAETDKPFLVYEFKKLSAGKVLAQNPFNAACLTYGRNASARFREGQNIHTCDYWVYEIVLRDADGSTHIVDEMYYGGEKLAHRSLPEDLDN